MYRLKPGVKQDARRRWALPDRVFFGHGACHILAGVFLRMQPVAGFHAERLVPGDGFSGNHVYVTDGTIAFDYHGYSNRLRLVRKFTSDWSGAYDGGWTCHLERVGFDLLCTRDLNARKMLGPDQYADDVIARARRFVGRINPARAAQGT